MEAGGTGLAKLDHEVPKTRSEYGHGYEANAVRHELCGFRYRESPAYAAVLEYFGPDIRLRELKGMIYTAKKHILTKLGVGLPALSRNAKRSFPLLIKYIQDNYDILVPLFPKVWLYDEGRMPVTLGKQPFPMWAMSEIKHS